MKSYVVTFSLVLAGCSADSDGAGDPSWRNLMLTNLKAPGSAQSTVITTIQGESGVGEFIVYWDDAYFVALE